MVIAGTAMLTRRFDAAVRAFREAVEMDPQMVQAWTMIIRINLTLGNVEAARAAADQAVTLNPDDIGLSLLRADIPG